MHKHICAKGTMKLPRRALLYVQTIGLQGGNMAHYMSTLARTFLHGVVLRYKISFILNKIFYL